MTCDKIDQHLILEKLHYRTQDIEIDCQMLPLKRATYLPVPVAAFYPPEAGRSDSGDSSLVHHQIFPC